jgi:RNA polymerase sigma factor (sigma-70 family)
LSRGEIIPLRDDQIEGLFRSHARDLRRFALGVLKDPALADDVVQTSFAKLTQHGPLPDQSAYRAWLFKVAYNEAVTLIRRKQTHAAAMSQMAYWIADKEATESGPAEADRNERIERVREAIKGLPPTERQVVQQRIYENKKFREIAESLDIPLGTALSRMRSALKKLGAILESLG